MMPSTHVTRMPQRMAPLTLKYSIRPMMHHADEGERDLRAGRCRPARPSWRTSDDGDAGVLQADERDEQADAGGDAVFQVLGDAVDQRLTELEQRTG